MRVVLNIRQCRIPADEDSSSALETILNPINDL